MHMLKGIINNRLPVLATILQENFRTFEVEIFKQRIFIVLNKKDCLIQTGQYPKNLVIGKTIVVWIPKEIIIYHNIKPANLKTIPWMPK